MQVLMHIKNVIQLVHVQDKQKKPTKCDTSSNIDLTAVIIVTSESASVALAVKMIPTSFSLIFTVAGKLLPKVGH